MPNPIATDIAAILKDDDEVFAITGNRVLDMDYRSAGWNTAPVNVFDADGIILPTVVVDDQGGRHPFMGPKDAEDNLLYVWAFSARSNQGHAQVTTLMRLAKRILASDMSPISYLSIRFDNRVGVQIADDGVLDRIVFKLSGIPSLT